MQAKHIEPESGDIVQLVYLSQHSMHHNRRHDLLFKDYKVVTIAKKKHPNIQPYRGALPWYQVTFVGVKSNESIKVDLCQLKYVSSPFKVPVINEPFGDKCKEKILHTRRPNLGELNFKLNMERRGYDMYGKPIEPAPEDKEAWRNLFNNGEELEVAFANKSNDWHKARESAFGWEKGKIIFRRKQ